MTLVGMRQTTQLGNLTVDTYYASPTDAALDRPSSVFTLPGAMIAAVPYDRGYKVAIVRDGCQTVNFVGYPSHRAARRAASHIAIDSIVERRARTARVIDAVCSRFAPKSTVRAMLTRALDA